MKKNTLILWIASIVTAFLSIYLSNLIDKDYPVTGTLGIGRQKVSYRFEKICYGNEDYKFIIRTDLDDLSGKLFWKNKTDTMWQSEQLQKSDLVLIGFIPSLRPGQSLDYFSTLYYKNKKYDIPDNQKVSLTFFAKIPVAVSVLEFLLLYLGLVLAVRTGLEYFDNGKNSKKLGVFTIIFFLTLIALINPLYITYKFGFINSSIPPIEKLFLWSDLTIFILWVVTIVTIFRFEKLKFLPLVTAVLTLMIFVLFR